MSAIKKTQDPTQHVTKPPPRRDYNAVVAKSHLRAVRLLESSFEVQPEFILQRDQAVLSLGGEPKSFQYDPAAGVAAGHFSWKVSAEINGKPVMTMSATYLVLYDGIIGCDKEAAHAFVQRVGAFAAFPYLRAHVAQMAWAADLDLPPLPVLKTEGD